MFKVSVNGKDITDYIIDINWSGDNDSSARKLEFNILYNPKDRNLNLLHINLGDKVNLILDKLQVYTGSVFDLSRASNTNTMQISCYDAAVFLSKSKTTRKFKKATAKSIIAQCCNDCGIPLGQICDGLDMQLNYIADNLSYSEIILKAFKLANAQTHKKYYYYINGKGQLCVTNNTTTLDKIILNGHNNIDSSTHSASIGDMVNTVIIVNKEGTQTGQVTNDCTKYGKIQAVYKIDPKQDTQTQAKSMLKGINYKSSISGLGNAQCIAGYAVMVQEGQLHGRFLITADRHNIAGNVHKMDLDLQYLDAGKDNKHEEK